MRVFFVLSFLVPMFEYLLFGSVSEKFFFIVEESHLYLPHDLWFSGTVVEIKSEMIHIELRFFLAPTISHSTEIIIMLESISPRRINIQFPTLRKVTQQPAKNSSQQCADYTDYFR